MVCLIGSQVEVFSCEKIDGWLQYFGVSDKFDVSKGIDWGVMFGLFYMLELGLGIGIVVVGLYCFDLQDIISQNLILMFSGYVSFIGVFGFSVKNYIFFDCDLWCVFVDGLIVNMFIYYWGQGFYVGDKDNEKEKYIVQVLIL